MVFFTGNPPVICIDDKRKKIFFGFFYQLYKVSIRENMHYLNFS